MSRDRVWVSSLAIVAVVLAPGINEAQEETAWDALVRKDPLVASEGATPRLERQILQRLTPEQAKRFIDGEDPETIHLVDGRWLQSWPAANNSAAALTDGQCGLTDGSAAGDWRLQTKAEWEGILSTLFRSDAASRLLQPTIAIASRTIGLDSDRRHAPRSGGGLRKPRGPRAG
jgi:hypothetical protein